MITAKIKCTEKIENGGEGDARGVALRFQPDYDDGRNQEWAIYTPSLNLTMNVKGAVADKFDVDQSYTLSFEKNDE